MTDKILPVTALVRTPLSPYCPSPKVEVREPPYLDNVRAWRLPSSHERIFFAFLMNVCRGRIDTPSLCTGAHDMAAVDQAVCQEN